MKSVRVVLQSLSCRLHRLSVAARVTCCLVTGLLLLLIGVWISYAWNPRYIPWSTYMSWSRGGVLATLIVGVTFVAYWTIRAWLADAPADRTVSSTWAQCLEQLQYYGLPIDALPIHLILGAGAAEEEERLLRASDEYPVAIPSGSPGGFACFANSRRVCLSAGRLGLTALARTHLNDRIRQWSPDLLVQQTPSLSLTEQAIGDTLVYGDDERRVVDQVPDRGEADSQADSDPLSRMLQAMGWEGNGANAGHDSIRSDGDPSAGGWSETASAYGVLAPTAPVVSLSAPNNAEPARTTTLRSVARPNLAKPLALIESPLEIDRTPLWSLAEAADCEVQLQQLALQIRRTRRPLCPINRIIVTVPIAVLLGDPHRVSAWALAIRRDLAVLQECLHLNAPVTVLVTDLERHPGFVEFLRRVGPSTSQQQSLGQAVEVGSPVTRTQLERLAVSACGQIEDCLYALLHKETALSSPGNAQLYRLLCDVRTGIRQSLSTLLVAAFDSTDQGDARVSLAGCYFCGNGPQPQQKGFVEAVWRLQDHGQEELEWLPEALERESIHHRLSQAGWIASAGLAVTWISMIRSWWTP
jgi:hypothetical protein